MSKEKVKKKRISGEAYNIKKQTISIGPKSKNQGCIMPQSLDRGLTFQHCV